MRAKITAGLRGKGGLANDPDGSVPGRGGGLEPAARVHGFAAAAYLEIQSGPGPAARIARTGDGLSRLHRGADLLEQLLVVAVEAHVAVAMVEDDQQPPPGQPVRVEDPALVDRPHVRAAICSDLDAI